MNYAIIAAGLGSRLRKEGVEAPKPLVKICGEAMIDRLIRIFRANNAQRITIIINEESPEVEAHLRKLMAAQGDENIHLFVQSTPSSMHSLAVMADSLADAPFCLTTVDTIFREADFTAYIQRFETEAPDGLMAVTDFIDDEKPLYVVTDAADRITAFCDKCPSPEVMPHPLISGGIYCLHPKALDVLRTCISQGQSRMRNFQRALVAAGLNLQAYRMTKILDVDHAGDIAVAERFLKTDTQ